MVAIFGVPAVREDDALRAVQAAGAMRDALACSTTSSRARIEAPLIGRDPELRRLLDVFDDAVQEHPCRLVTAVGSPGRGETRLGPRRVCGDGILGAL